MDLVRFEPTTLRSSVWEANALPSELLCFGVWSLYNDEIYFLDLIVNQAIKAMLNVFSLDRFVLVSADILNPNLEIFKVYFKQKSFSLFIWNNFYHDILGKRFFYILALGPCSFISGLF